MHYIFYPILLAIRCNLSRPKHSSSMERTGMGQTKCQPGLVSRP